MPRQRILRKVVEAPPFNGYKPYGMKKEAGKQIYLLYEEYEAIKLADYDLKNHIEAAKDMGISRATFARIYESARRKIAKTLAEGRELKTSYGDVILDKDWFLCKSCDIWFSAEKEKTISICPECKSKS